ncbi:MAG: hypothetical protein J5U19_06430 [Candidatus Methanoperedens sp.]|nr:hypothetical protein [Candidatus Methanoperedens sp.]
MLSSGVQRPRLQIEFPNIVGDSSFNPVLSFSSKHEAIPAPRFRCGPVGLLMRVGGRRDGIEGAGMQYGHEFYK